MASEGDRRNLFLETAVRLGTPLRNVEKDFWVCFVLDLLFNGRAANEPRLLFKGGTSLSKAYDLISRFSEDIDITVYREDIGHSVDLAVLQSWGKNKRADYLKEIKMACSAYILADLKDRLTMQIQNALSTADITMPALRVPSGIRPSLRMACVLGSIKGVPWKITAIESRATTTIFICF